MQVNERISVINDSTQLDIEMRINAAKQNVISSIQAIVKQTLEDNQAILAATEASSKKIEQVKTLAEQFFAQHISEEKLIVLQSLSQRIKEATSQLANRAGQEIMLSPMRHFMGTMVAVTTQKNLVDFFLIQSMGAAQRLTEELEQIYTDEVVRQFFAPKPKS